jgi:hypothetical protein
MSAPVCPICEEVAGRIAAPGGPIYDDGLWLVSHHTGAWTDPGEVLVKPGAHCESLGQLTPAESDALGPILRAGVAAIERVLGPERTYAACSTSGCVTSFLPLPRTRRSRGLVTSPQQEGPDVPPPGGDRPQSHRRRSRRHGGATPGRSGMETVEVLIVGAGPAGLRAAQVLAGAGREVLVAEKHEEIGPKTCAGGSLARTVALRGCPDAPEPSGSGSGVPRPPGLDPARPWSDAATTRLAASSAGRVAGAEVRAEPW